MHKNEKFYNFRKLRNVLNSNKKKHVKIGRIEESLSANEKKKQNDELKSFPFFCARF